MATDYCSYLRSNLAKKLSSFGLAEEACDQFGQDFRGHGAMYAGSVIYFRGHGQLVAVAYSLGDGPSCFVGPGDADRSTYRQWSSLWDLAGMSANLDEQNLESLGAYMDRFPEKLDAMFALIAEKLGKLFAS